MSRRWSQGGLPQRRPTAAAPSSERSDQAKARRGDKRQRIIEAAVKVFAEKGFYNAKVSEIARASGVANGTIYLYFRNKDDILISLFEEEMKRIIERMKAEIEREQGAVRKIEKFALMHLSLIEENKGLAEVLQVELRQSSKFMKEYRNRRFAEYVNLISAIIRQGQKEGVVRADVMPGVAKRAFFGALDEMSRFWVLSRRKKYSIQTAARQIADFFLRGIATQPAP
jgi:TetR/AcrR family fatty acid metabolism transcriptional regulator